VVLVGKYLGLTEDAMATQRRNLMGKAELLSNQGDRSPEKSADHAESEEGNDPVVH